MTSIKNRFEKRILEIEAALNVAEVGQVFIKSLPSRSTLCIRHKITDRTELELSLKELEKKAFNNSFLFIGMVGLTVSKSALENMIFDEYSAIFILPEENVEHNPFKKVIGEGEYACIYYRESFRQSAKYYKQLLDYIKENDYVIIGDAVERVIIDNLVTKNLDKHLSEIQIPIKKPKDRSLLET